MDLIHICPNWSPYPWSSLCDHRHLSRRSWLAGGDYSKIRLTFQEYFKRLGEDPRHAGDSQLQHCLVHMRHRWDLDLHRLVERTVCLEHSMILMYHQHCVSFAVDVAKTTDVITPELKKAGNRLDPYLISKQMQYDLPIYSEV